MTGSSRRAQAGVGAILEVMAILIVTADSALAGAIRSGLEVASYGALATADVWADADAPIRFEAVIVDAEQSGKDVFSWLRQWRDVRPTGVILVLGSPAWLGDAGGGLHLGGENFLPRESSFDEILGRLHSLVRRHRRSESVYYEHGPVVVDRIKRRVTVDGAAVNLTAREYVLLELLLEQRGRVLTRTKISERVWERNHDPASNLIDVYVHRLRRKISGGPRIRSVRGEGYILE
jgi:two-component system, OmpR family, response regulator